MTQKISSSIHAIIFVCVLQLIGSHSAYAQSWSKADSLRGSLRLERNCYDVLHYDLHVDFDLENKSIAGYNTISFLMLDTSSHLQIDLFDNMEIQSIIHNKQHLDFYRLENAVFVDASNFSIGKQYDIKVNYQGRPIIARMAPWDGGFVWSEQNNKHWVAVACEGLGASVWWPNKDHLSDEPDSMDMHYSVAKPYEAIANGQLMSIQEEHDKRTFHWHVSKPINNYNVTFNITEYDHFSDWYITTDLDSLRMDYYVLPENLEKAKVHFEQAKPVLEAFEHYFGTYPFIEDGYKLIETPYLGMEHQSAIAYGNRYMRGYLGGMIPPEMDYDYIILHETGHEYFGNAVSCKDHAEMWIHESFTTYMESLFVEHQLGREAAERYLSFQRRHANKSPIIGPIGVNYSSWGGSDHYFKGAWILHTLRHHINDDILWFSYLKALYQEFKFKNISSQDIFEFSNQYFNKDLQSFFDQYLKYASIPKLIHEIEENGNQLKLRLKWATDVADFEMGLKFGKSNKTKYHLIKSNEWSEFIFDDMKIDELTFATHQYLFEME